MTPPLVGFHILSKHIEGEVCGFCGLITCLNKLKQTSKTKDKTYYKIDSKCNYVFPYKRQPTYSTRERCTNYLAKCEARDCGTDVWKYHMAEHYKAKHPKLHVPKDLLISNEEKNMISSFKQLNTSGQVMMNLDELNLHLGSSYVCFLFIFE